MDPDRVRTGLQSLAAQDGVSAAILTTAGGQLVAVAPLPDDPAEAAATREWAAEQAGWMIAIQAQVREPVMSVLVDRAEGSRRPHYHLQEVGDHLLVVLFDDRASLRLVKGLCRTAAAFILGGPRQQG